jgi:hypothetical protein
MVLLCLGPRFLGTRCFCPVQLFADFNTGGTESKSMEGAHFEEAATLAPNLEEESSGHFWALSVALFVFFHVSVPNIHLLAKGKMKLTCINNRKGIVKATRV